MDGSQSKGQRIMKRQKERRISITIKKTYEYFCGFLLFLAVLISIVEIVTRTVFGIAYDLFFDLPVWLTVWALLLIAGPLLPEGGHVSIDFLRVKFKNMPRLAIEIFNAVCTLAYGALFTVGAVLFLHRLYLQKAVFPRYFAVPMWIVELCVPIALLIFTAYAIIGFIKVIKKKW